jgi:hypothetical protein
VRFGTVTLKGTTIFISPYKLAGLPLFADLVRRVAEQVGLTSEVLPVMREETLAFIVFVCEGTPFSFKVKQEECFILGHLIDKRYLDITLCVRERAVIFIQTLGVNNSAEFEFITLLVIEVLHLVVRHVAARI